MNGSTGIPTSPNLAFRFNQPVSSSSVASNVTLSSAGGAIALNLARTNDSTRVVLTPAAPLALGTTYKVTYGAGIVNSAGTPLTNPGNFSFTTTSHAGLSLNEFELYPEDSTASSAPLPVGTDVQPKVVSSAALDATTVDAKSLVLVDRITGSVIPAVVSLSNDGLELVLKPDSPLLPNHPYQITASGNLSGLTGLAYFYPFAATNQFITGSGPMPVTSVVSISPPNGERGLSSIQVLPSNLHLTCTSPVC